MERSAYPPPHYPPPHGNTHHKTSYHQHEQTTTTALSIHQMRQIPHKLRNHPEKRCTGHAIKAKTDSSYLKITQITPIVHNFSRLTPLAGPRSLRTSQAAMNKEWMEPPVKLPVEGKPHVTIKSSVAQLKCACTSHQTTNSPTDHKPHPQMGTIATKTIQNSCFTPNSHLKQTKTAT